MLWVKVFHIIFVITWFSGLFYLPRLFVYHAMATDTISTDRFKVMERKLYYAITYPSAILTTVFGIWLMSFDWSYYSHAGWMHAKLGLVALLWIYHFSCGYYLRRFRRDENKHSHVFYRYYNEVTSLLLLGIVILVVVRPF